MFFVWIAIFVLPTSSYNPEENAHINDPNLFEGDMILTPEQRQAALQGEDIDKPQGRGSVVNKRWPGGIMVYTIHSTLASEPRAVSAINAAMEEWSKLTCIRFKKRTSEKAYVRFIQGYDCSSHVGRLGVRQSISLRSGCWKKFVAVHEIGHALGFYHEQSRPDRDDYVTIRMYDNILESKKLNFKKYSRSKIESLGTPYDYGSVMHYKEDGFSVNGQPTIVPKKPGVTIGQRSRISPVDAQQMNLLYKNECARREASTISPAGLTTAAPSCEDKSRDCKYWKRFCNSDVEFVKENCNRTCNRC